MPTSPTYQAAPRFPTLGPSFYDEVVAARFPSHILRFRNDRWAERVGLGALTRDEWIAHFARFEPLPDNLTKPLALRYHGHQFDVYNPHLGDGRGFLFAQLLEDDTGLRPARSAPAGTARLLDLATKGSGTTPWSRGGDGRLTLKGGVREVLATEMLEALGVNTSKSFSLVETGEALTRGDEPSPTRSSVLVRLGHSHVRFGTFQRLAHARDRGGLERLLTYSIASYFPHLAEAAPASSTSSTSSRGVTRFLAEVTRATAALAAGFMVAGFVHGVLNSDNMCITGEAFDYGPYRFLPRYDLGFVAAYFDHQGLYAYGRQPRAIFRNLVRLAEALRPLASDLALGSALADFEPVMSAEVTRGVIRRLGLAPSGDTDDALVSAVYAFLDESVVGYDRFFFDWRGGLGRESRALSGEGKELYAGARWNDLRRILELYVPTESALPAYFDDEGPCTLLIDEIERIWTAIADKDDWGPFEQKIAAIRRMGEALGPAATP